MKTKLTRHLPHLALLIGLHATAAPWRPTEPTQVLEVLPTRLLEGTRETELRAMRDKLTKQPGDAETAVALSRQYLLQARASSDPRYLGYAEAALAPWAMQARIPPQVRLMRAVLAQRNHQFDRAMVDLDQVVSERPHDAEALLTRATIRQVRGDYAAARKDCSALLTLDTLLLGAICKAQVDSLSGNAQTSLALLQKLSERQADSLTPSIREWLWLAQADIAQRLGDKAATEAAFQQMQSQKEAGPESRVAYADYLLEQKRYQEVITLTSNDVRNDNALLRLALAEKALKLPSAAGHIAEIGERFDAARLRGDRVHLREEARFRLGLLGDAKGALALAQANWQVQREPADVRLLLEAAIAAGNKEVASQVATWIKQTQMQDVALSPLLQSLLGAKS
ncbi:hypothetical protein [Chitinimonas sp.]|uniref:tetratricopeptide repeat protein n=1 Tax=Chitinimonas sp. TaxID=1934313 RepID=UPI0035AE812F